MNMRLITVLIMLAGVLSLSCVNIMHLVWTMNAEQQNDHFGSYIAALDFNGDGYDDLAVTASAYHPDENYPTFWGKLYIYWGSANGLSDSCSYSVTTEIDTTKTYISRWREIRNLGDMNGDGCEDLGCYFHWSSTSRDWSQGIEILLGNTVNDTLVDYTFETSQSLSTIEPLGDVNGDGYCDAGITDDVTDSSTYTLIYGGTFETLIMVYDLYNRGDSDFRGLGDINGDGYDDFYYHFTAEGTPQPDGHTVFPYNDWIFLGAPVIDTEPDICREVLRTSRQGFLLRSVGDFNADGYDDFACNTNYNMNADFPGMELWRGGEEIHWEWTTILECNWSYFRPLPGDFNNDGYSDIIYGDDPYIRGILGGQNGTQDIYFNYDDNDDFYPQFAVGDFNGDGCDDVAVGDDGDDDSHTYYNGIAYVYAGNTDLEESDPNPVDDQTVPEVSIWFNAYPNPFNPEICFDIQAQNYREIQLDIFNIKGQLVDTLQLNAHSSTVTWRPETFASGVYMCMLKADGKVLSSKKITLMK